MYTPEASGFLVGERALQSAQRWEPARRGKPFKLPWAARRWVGGWACTGPARNPRALLGTPAPCCCPPPPPHFQAARKATTAFGTKSEGIFYGWPSAPPTSLSSSAPPARRVSSPAPQVPRTWRRAALFQVTANQEGRGAFPWRELHCPSGESGSRRLFKEMIDRDCEAAEGENV